MLTESDGRHSIDARASTQFEKDTMIRKRAQWNEFTAYKWTVLVDVMSKKSYTMCLFWINNPNHLL